MKKKVLIIILISLLVVGGVIYYNKEYKDVMSKTNDKVDKGEEERLVSVNISCDKGYECHIAVDGENGYDYITLQASDVIFE